MHPLEKKTLITIEQEGLLEAGEKIVIGVSAGPDSMALLHVLNRLTHVMDITPVAAYVNHGLRPDESESEKNLVATEAHRLGVDFFTGSRNVKELAAKQKISIEHAARILRYEFLEKTALDCGAQKIALAHTADDQSEELLLRLIRGTARKGLSGMKTLRAGRFIRPFLRFPKSDLLDYLEKHSIPFLLDSSNAQNLYLRNRIRNDLLPYLKEGYNPDIRRTLLRTANILQDEEELLETITESAFAETVNTIQQMHVQEQENSIPPGESYPQELQLSLELFKVQPRAIQRRLLEKCCWIMACEPRSRQIENLLQLAMPGSSDGSLHLSDGLRVMRNKEQLHFTYPHGRGPFRGNLPTEYNAELQDTIIPAPGIYEFPALNKRLVIEDIEGSFPKSGDSFPAGEYLDAALFSFPLSIRSPYPDDRFHPLGAPGSKKINDFLSDQKINRHEKKQVPVLCSDDSILALPGHRIDHRYRITEKTTSALRVNWVEIKSEIER
jgi:tRNA(Ile)-lysidine synthase